MAVGNDEVIPENLTSPAISTAFATTAAALVGWLPPIAALFGIVVCAITIYESKTFQHWKRNRVLKHRAKKLAKLRAKEKLVIAEIQALETLRAAKVEASEMVADAKSEAAQLIIHATADALTPK